MRKSQYCRNSVTSSQAVGQTSPGESEPHIRQDVSSYCESLFVSRTHVRENARGTRGRSTREATKASKGKVDAVGCLMAEMGPLCICVPEQGKAHRQSCNVGRDTISGLLVTKTNGYLSSLTTVQKMVMAPSLKVLGVYETSETLSAEAEYGLFGRLASLFTRSELNLLPAEASGLTRRAFASTKAGLPYPPRGTQTRSVRNCLSSGA